MRSPVTGTYDQATNATVVLLIGWFCEIGIAGSSPESLIALCLASTAHNPSTSQAHFFLRLSSFVIKSKALDLMYHGL
jgi:hypothetical protein